ncbi:MAG: YraN family protein [Clostridia bacterium]|nr:YraN family protein [Clostridia bacterium]
MNGRENVRAGLIGEMRALHMLKKAGMKPLAWRYRAAGGEVDLIVKDRETLVFVEVKFRADGRIGDGVRAVNGDKRRRIRQAARHYLAYRIGREDLPVRFDVVEITRAGNRHIRNAF